MFANHLISSLSWCLADFHLVKVPTIITSELRSSTLIWLPSSTVKLVHLSMIFWGMWEWDIRISYWDSWVWNEPLNFMMFHVQFQMVATGRLRWRELPGVTSSSRDLVRALVPRLFATRMSHHSYTAMLICRQRFSRCAPSTKLPDSPMMRVWEVL